MQRKYSGSAKGALVNSWTWRIYLDKTNRQQNQQWLREDPRHVVYGPLGQNETFSSLLNSKKLLGGFYLKILRWIVISVLMKRLAIPK